MSSGRFQLEHAAGDAEGFHERAIPDPAGRALWWFEVDRPTLVLGSTQPSDLVEADRAAAAGVAVVRRRSGGGAVWLAPGEVTWVDVVVPAGDPLWCDDVSRSALWLGEAWVAALGSLGIGGLAVHRSELVRTPWSSLVCFAGMAPGEVHLDGAKVVGISQRRTRAGARFQCAVVHRWDPQPVLELIEPDPRRRAEAAVELWGAGSGIGRHRSATVVAALVAALPTA